ncbi:hypothetical protein [Paraburkholderia silvatlantica]|uniref:hypothetical protein n=1 Tax=Paraburkholderia silvatlantica TaxID=321895 RepID=UPI003752BBA7
MVNYETVLGRKKQKSGEPGENTERSLQSGTFKVAEDVVPAAKTLTGRALTRVWCILAAGGTWGNHRPKKVF